MEIVCIIFNMNNDQNVFKNWTYTFQVKDNFDSNSKLQYNVHARKMQ